MIALVSKHFIAKKIFAENCISRKLKDFECFASLKAMVVDFIIQLKLNIF